MKYAQIHGSSLPTRSRKAVTNFLRLQKEYGTKKKSWMTVKERQFPVQRRIVRPASMKSLWH
uniref:Transposase n=1 Tax=Heterorhabditis bacteriophora TaxID=37862 RepID=A0A1I7X446_HETBA